MGGYIGINGKSKEAKEIYIGVNGVARKVEKAYIGVNGSARLWYTGFQRLWDDLFSSIDDGTYKEKYKIGDMLPINLGGEGIVNMQIVAMDADEKADGSGKAPITWVSERPFTGHRMGTGSYLSWENTELRSYLKSTVKPMIPDNVRGRIVDVTKYSAGYDNSGRASNMETSDDVWIPSYREIFGGTSYETQGVIYNGIFKSADTRKKKSEVGDYFINWLLRSAAGATSFVLVNREGKEASGDTSVAYSVVLGFCT